MRKIIPVFLALVIITAVYPVSAHQDVYGFFFFETYTGSADLKTLPKRGSYGEWTRNNCTNDGVTSALTEKGTSLVLHKERDNYPGIRYNVSDSADYLTDGIHVSYSFMTEGATNRVFRFRKKTASLYESVDVITINTNDLVNVYGKRIYCGDLPLRIKQGVWYDVDVRYDVNSGYTEVFITDGDKVYFCKRKSGKTGKLGIYQILWETSERADGNIKNTYIDNVLIESTDGFPPVNETDDFEDFAGNDLGTFAPKGFKIQNFLPYSGTGYKYAGAFRYTRDDNGMLKIAENNDYGIYLLKQYDLAAEMNAAVEMKTEIQDLNSTRVLYAGYNGNFEEAVRIESKSGRVYVFNNNTDFCILPYTQYSLKLLISNESKTGVLYINGDNNSFYYVFRFDGHKSIDALKFSIENYAALYGNETAVLLDDIVLRGLTGEETDLLSHSGFEIGGVTFLKDGKELSAVTDGHITVRTFIREGLFTEK